MSDHPGRLTDEQVERIIATNHPKSAFATLAGELQERRAADTRTPSFTADEMEAIRTALLGVDDSWRVEGNWDRGEWLRHAGLPESVIAWVLGDPSTASDHLADSLTREAEMVRKAQLAKAPTALTLLCQRIVFLEQRSKGDAHSVARTAARKWPS